MTTSVSAPRVNPRPKPSVGKDSPFYVSPTLDYLSRLVTRFPNLWLRLGSLESSLLAPRLSRINITQPIYICGLARSGSTLLHEILSSHSSVGTHRIKDYPFISTPYWWRTATAFNRATSLRERPHRDTMMVSSESPDAIEEMLWMAFFPQGHNPQIDNRLTARERNPKFDSYYQNHLRKLLLAEKATRYVAKANYHIARLEYLLQLFPDARFVIPVRSPISHIGSLARQHEWFSQGHRQVPQSLAVMQRSGHFEFGLDRRPIHLGNSELLQQIRRAWESGEETLGWSIYWDMVYRYLADLLDSHEGVRKASLVVRFDELCEEPQRVLKDVFEHCRLTDYLTILDKYVSTIRRPNYYESPFSLGELAQIRNQTDQTAERWGVPNEMSTRNNLAPII